MIKRFLNSISKHPFIFLIFLLTVASFCYFLAAASLGGDIDVESSMKPMTQEFIYTKTSTEVSQEITESGTEISVIIQTQTIAKDKTKTVTVEPLTITQTMELEGAKLGNPLVVYFFDVGQGDSILIEAPDGEYLLLDGGSSDDGVVTFLQALKVTHIDLMVATHPHEDHIGGLIQVLDVISVDIVVTNGQPHSTTTYELFLDAIRRSDADYLEVKRGDKLTLGELELNVLNPTASLVEDFNENSIVLTLEYGMTKFLFMGDAGETTEYIMMRDGILVKADILKIGHHGSCASSSLAFLQVVMPDLAIYSSGTENPFNHPCDEIMDRMESMGIWILGTDTSGSILVTGKQDGYTVTDAYGIEIAR